jgi:hypothetical protein
VILQLGVLDGVHVTKSYRRIILKWVLKKYIVGGHVLDSCDSGSGQMVEFCGVDNESSGCIKTEFFK